MDEEIKAEWTKRLRSGKIPQIKGNLGQVGGGRCCLGVLCDIAVENGVIPTPTVDDEGVLAYVDNTGVLPEEVVQWAELHDDAYNHTNYAGYYGESTVVNTTSNAHALTDDNDQGKTFDEIADIIEANF